MQKLNLVVLLGFLIPSAGIAQQPPASWTVRESGSGASALPYMKGVCGAHAALMKEDGKSIAACQTCPTGASSPDGPLRATKVVEFAHPKEGKVVLISTTGCASGHNWEGGTVILRSRGGYTFGASNGKWAAPEFKEGWDLQSCQWRAGSSIFGLCQSEEGGQGSSITDVSIATISSGKLAFLPVGTFEDHEMACSFDGKFSESVKDATVVDVDGDGTEEVVLLVESKTGKYLTPPSRGVDNCDDVEKGLVKVSVSKHALYFRRGLDGQMKPAKIAGKAVKVPKVRAWLGLK